MGRYDDAFRDALRHLDAIRCSSLMAPPNASGPADIQRCSLPLGHNGPCEPTDEDILEWAERWDPRLAEELHRIRDGIPAPSLEAAHP